MNQIEKANAACALANITTRAAIRALKAAIVEMKEMRDSGEVPDDCMDTLNAHLNGLRMDKNNMKAMLANRKVSCGNFVDCLEGGGIIVPQDGGGK